MYLDLTAIEKLNLRVLTSLLYPVAVMLKLIAIDIVAI